MGLPFSKMARARVPDEASLGRIEIKSRWVSLVAFNLHTGMVWYYFSPLSPAVFVMFLNEFYCDAKRPLFKIFV